MHHYADLSDGFWKLAVDTAIHVVNRLPKKCLNWKTSIELWEGKVLDLSYLQTFGCKANVMVQEEQRHGKLHLKPCQ